MRWTLLALGIAACGGADDTVEECTADQVLATECAECGPDDGCLREQQVCATRCDTDATACDAEGGLCMGGACLHGVCG